MIRDSNRLSLKLGHPRFAVLMTGFWMISLIRVVLGFNLPIYIYLIYSVVLCVLSTPVEIVSFMCSLIAFSGSFQYRYGLLIAIIVFIAKKGIKKLNIRLVIPLLLMMVWELAHISMSGLTVYGFLQEFSELIALTVIMLSEPLDYSDGLPIRTFSYCTLFSCFLNLIASILVLGFSLTSMNRLGKIGIDISDFQSLIDPNTMGFMCAFAICGLVLIRHKKREYTSDYIVSLLLFIFILLSQSKSAILGVIVIYILFVFFTEKPKSVSSKKFFRVIMILGIAVLLSGTLFKTIIQAVIQRFQANDITTGRSAIFMFYTMHLFSSVKYMLFGIGLFNYNSQITKLYGNLWESYPGLATYRDDVIVYKPSHNNIQEILVVWGIIGIILVILLIKAMIDHYSGQKEKINYIPMIFLFIYGLQGEFLSAGGALMLLMFSLVCMEYIPIKKKSNRILNI